jgi:hypothetical protein
MNKRLISFSLYGDSKIYCNGALANVELAQRYYPGWIPRFYVAKNCPAISDLKASACEVVEMPAWQGVDRLNDKNWHNNKHHLGMIWRFQPAFEESVERVIFRDCDSRLNPREAAAVTVWEQSGCLAHMMCENENHLISCPQGGMVGIAGGIFNDFESRLETFIDYYSKSNEALVFIDIHFLRSLFNDMSFSILHHGFGGLPFPDHEPIPPELGRFVGDIINEELRKEVFVSKIDSK